MAGTELVETALGSHIFRRYVDLKRKECLETASGSRHWELDRCPPLT
jgi:glutamine synthetase